MKKTTIVQGHPDPSAGRLNRALAERYAEAAIAGGGEVRYVDVASLDFPLLRKPEDFYNGKAPDAIRAAQEDIAWADHLVFFYPLWMGDVPSLLKAFIEQTFRPGFAMAYGARLPKGLLRGKSARLVVTMGMPAFFYSTMFGAHTVKAITLNLQMCGIKPVRHTFIGGVGEACAKTRERWLNAMRTIAEEDAAAQPRRARHVIAVAARAVGFAGLLGAGAYLGRAALTFARFGNTTRSDSLLDSVMPAYDVRLDHRVAIEAPASIAFEAMHHTDFERSPIVQALFRAREILLGSRHAKREISGGLFEQLEAIGWRAVAEDPGRELVFGTVTQPWRADPVFHPLPREDFAAFDQPGYAKIAFTLRVDPDGAQRSIARTETRVQTTDTASRMKFRRYFALLSPGIELLRLVLLQQVKSEAESRRLVAAQA